MELFAVLGASSAILLLWKLVGHTWDYPFSFTVACVFDFNHWFACTMTDVRWLLSPVDRLQVQESDFSVDELSDCSSGSIEVCCDDLTPGWRTSTHLADMTIIINFPYSLSPSLSDSCSLVLVFCFGKPRALFSRCGCRYWQPDAGSSMASVRTCQRPTFGSLCVTWIDWVKTKEQPFSVRKYVCRAATHHGAMFEVRWCHYVCVCVCIGLGLWRDAGMKRWKREMGPGW